MKSQKEREAVENARRTRVPANRDGAKSEKAGDQNAARSVAPGHPDDSKLLLSTFMSALAFVTKAKRS